MTDLSALIAPDKGQPATPLHLVDKKSFEAWLKAQPGPARRAAEAQGFKGEGFQLAILPGERETWSAVLGVANVDELSPWCLARAAESLPEGQLSGRRARAGSGNARLAARPISVRPLPPGEEGRGPAHPAHRRAGADRRDGAGSPKRPSWSATSSTCPAGDLGPAELEAAALALGRRDRRQGQRHPRPGA